MWPLRKTMKKWMKTYNKEDLMCVYVWGGV